MRQGPKTMKEHSNELNSNNEEKEEHQYDTNWFQMEVFLCNQNLKLKQNKIIIVPLHTVLLMVVPSVVLIGKSVI